MTLAVIFKKKLKEIRESLTISLPDPKHPPWPTIRIRLSNPSASPRPAMGHPADILDAWRH